MSRFVILCHTDPRGTHFDLMLEAGDVLKTWALLESPRPGAEMECEALGDHRLAYLDYEGPISGGRGSVTCWDRGTYTVEQQNETQWAVILAGEKQTGSVRLCRTANDSNRWIISFV